MKRSRSGGQYCCKPKRLSNCSLRFAYLVHHCYITNFTIADLGATPSSSLSSLTIVSMLLNLSSKIIDLPSFDSYLCQLPNYINPISRLSCKVQGIGRVVSDSAADGPTRNPESEGGRRVDPGRVGGRESQFKGRE